jgi:hypothetical protein
VNDLRIPRSGDEEEEETLMSTAIPQEPSTGPVGRLDGSGAGDCDEPYRFGSRPRATAPDLLSTDDAIWPRAAA